MTENQIERQSAEVKIYSVERFEDKVKAINNKAAKAGVAPVKVAVGSEWIKEKVWQKTPWSDGEVIEVVYFYKVGQIEWSEIRYDGGWRLQGVLDHQENLVKSVPGGEVELTPYLERGPVCDHCHTYRDRKETFVLENEAGEVKQVGRSCIHLFLGVSVERALSGVGMLSELGGLSEEQRGFRAVHGYGIEAFIQSAATMIRLNGWRSRSAVYNGGQQGLATADQAWANLENAELRRKDRQGVPLWEDPSDEDKVTAKAVVAWLVALSERRGLNDYLSNLRQIGQNDFVTGKSSGFAASAVVAWGKEREEEIKRAAKRAEQGPVADEYVGKVGERLVFKGEGGLVLTKSFGFENEWGVSYIHRFVDKSGHLFVWKTGVALDLGEYAGKGTVKAHEEYKGEKQTVLTRASLELVKEGEKVAA